MSGMDSMSKTRTGQAMRDYQQPRTSSRSMPLRIMLPLQLEQRLALDLAHALAREAQAVGQHLQRLGLAVVQAEAARQHLALAVVQLVEPVRRAAARPRGSASAPIGSMRRRRPRCRPAIDARRRVALQRRIERRRRLGHRQQLGDLLHRPPQHARRRPRRAPACRPSLAAASDSFSSVRRARSTWCSSRTTCTGSRISRAWCMTARSTLWRIHQEA